MTTVEDLEKAVAELPPDQLQRFRAWFAEFEAARFDQKIEQDDKAVRLDRLAEQALAEYRAGRARELKSISRAPRFGKHTWHYQSTYVHWRMRTAFNFVLARLVPHQITEVLAIL